MRLFKLILPLITLQFFVLSCASMDTRSASQPAPRTLTVSLQAPNLAWSVTIEEIYQVDKELWVIAQLSRRPGMAGQMISTVEDTVKIAAADLPVKYYVLGKTWGWENKEQYTFLNDRKSIAEKLRSGTLLYERKKD